jgi:hypothetical protein
MGAHCDPLSRSFRLETNPYKSTLQGESSHSLSQSSRDDAVTQEKNDAWIIDKVSRGQRRHYNISCIRYFGETQMPSAVMRSFDSHLMSETPVALSGAFLEQVGIVLPVDFPDSAVSESS